MADKLFKINEAIEIGYQAPNAATGLLEVVAEIYLPNKTKNSFFPNVELVEVADTGTYRGSFTPNAVGTWQVIIHKAGALSKEGQVIKAYSVGNYNLNDIGVAVEAVQSSLTALGDVATSGDVTTAQGAITDAIAALNNIDAGGVQTAAAAAITAANLATATNVTDTQTALANLINALNNLSEVQVQSAAAAAITAAGLATAVAVGNVQTAVDNIAIAVGGLDTPAMAF